MTGISQEETKKQSNEGRAIFICLDKSGSMSGTPFNALQAGTSLIGKSLFESNAFEYVVVVFFESRAYPTVCKN